MHAPKKELVKAEKGTELHEKKKTVVARWDRIAWHLQRHFLRVTCFLKRISHKVSI